MTIIKDKVEKNVHKKISSWMVFLWLLVAGTSLYFFESDNISNKSLMLIWGGYLFIWTLVDLILGIQYKEFPQFIADVKLEVNPKTYWFRLLFNLSVMMASGYFVVIKLLGL